MADHSYTAMVTFDGLPLDGMVRRDDGAIVLTEAHEPGPDTLDYQAWLEAGNAPAPAAPLAPPVPDVISDRQCFQQLAILGKITQGEALAAVTTGTLPQAVVDGIGQLPAAEQFPARMLLCGATQFERLHPMVPVFLGFFRMDGAADRDALWTAAATL